MFPNAFHSVSCAPLGQSDHNLIFLIPVYRCKSKHIIPVKRVVKEWSVEEIDMLRDCLEVTDWSVFKESCFDLNEYTEVVTSYISFCETVCVPSKAVTIYNNNKPWFNKEIKILWREKHKAFKSGIRAL